MVVQLLLVEAFVSRQFDRRDGRVCQKIAELEQKIAVDIAHRPFVAKATVRLCIDVGGGRRGSLHGRAIPTAVRGVARLEGI